MFNKLKAQFIKDLILYYFNLKNEIIMEINAFNEVIAKVLSQKNAQKIVRLIVYFFIKITLIKLNYEIYNKKLLAII